MSALGLGIIGCGFISEIYLKNARLFPQLDLRAVADLNADAAGAKAAAHGTTALTPEALLARDDIDIVLNLTVPAAHLSVGLAALQAGKHVFRKSRWPSAWTTASAWPRLPTRGPPHRLRARHLPGGLAPDLAGGA
ncbi:Gfo/Idh/MocA family protein [Paracoccus aerius]